MLVGCAMILLGVALFYVQHQDWDVPWSRTWWTFILMFLGAERLINPGVQDGVRASRRTGLWLFAIGAWGLVNEMRLFGLTFATSWPLLVIVAGINTVWKALEPPRPARERRAGEN